MNGFSQLKLFWLSFVLLASIVPAMGTGQNRSIPSPGGLLFVSIPGGSFTMGSPVTEPEREPWEKGNEKKHRVAVGSFLMSATVVTQAQWRVVMGHNPSDFQGDTLPVEQVSWYDAVEFCNKLSLKEGKSPAYLINGSDVTWNKKATGYRLPTEAEWEYAARAGTTTAFYTGDNITTDQANFDGRYPYNGNKKGTNRGKTVPVASFSPNPWGLYDMAGNVWQWCWDRYGPYDETAVQNPSGDSASGSFRVFRGGSWCDRGEALRSANRYIGPDTGHYYIGLRLVLPAL